jgi:hypothetical protein
MPCTFLFFTFQNIPFYTGIISHTHISTFSMCIPPIWIPPICLFLVTISICKNILAHNIRANTIVKLHILKQPIKEAWRLFQHTCVSKCHTSLLAYTNIKFSTINLSCTISLKVLHDKRTNKENYWSSHKIWA